MYLSHGAEGLRGKRVAVVGLGISNLPLIDFLLAHGARVTGRDQKTRDALGETATALEQKGVRLRLGEGYLDEMDEPIVFRSPGLRPDLPQFCEAVQKGAILTSEMELFLDLTPATVLGITGSDGKTTTTTLTGLFLTEECKKTARRRVYVGGNLGHPLLPSVEKMTEEDYAVIELSSFQLQALKRSPVRAAITNVTPNHLNWHTDMEEYIKAKANIYRHAPNTALVANAENAITRELAQASGRQVTYFSSKKDTYQAFGSLLRDGDRAVYLREGKILLWDGETEREMLDTSLILLPGMHNVENYMTAIALTDGLVSAESIRAVAESFHGVPHRLEPVRTVDGVLYYNSSIDSSPTRTAAALSALRERPIVICGGCDKKIPFDSLAEALCKRAKAVVLTGATATAIRQALDAYREKTGAELPIYTDPDFTRAVMLARSVAKPGDTVLLSPACTSFDAFKNFEERGDTFKKIVESF